MMSFSCVNNVGGEREIQKSYWIEHSADLTVEAMMLDSKAADLDKEERPEVISLSLYMYVCVYIYIYLLMDLVMIGSRGDSNLWTP